MTEGARGPLRELREAVDRIERQLVGVRDDIRALSSAHDSALDKVRVEVGEIVNARMARCGVCAEQAGAHEGG